jgi:UPF0271 protein
MMDLNADLGESFGAYTLGDDAALMPLLTSVNIACGFHAGDPLVMIRSVELAKKYDIAIGAHPGYPDLQGFGRRAMAMEPEEVAAMVLYQIGALAGFCTAEGVTLHHVKPHGALYNQAAKDPILAEAIVRAVKSFSRDMVLYGLAGSTLTVVGEAAGMQVAHEGFPERVYETDGSLRSRSKPGALITETEKAAVQALRLVREGVEVKGSDGVKHQRVDTLCMHGDSTGAVGIARAVRQELLNAGISISAFLPILSVLFLAWV